jgi:hypothetical protein
MHGWNSHLKRIRLEKEWAKGSWQII